VKNFLGHQRLETTEKYLHQLKVDRSIHSFIDEGEEEKKRN